MSVRIAIELPASALSAFRKNPVDFGKEMQLAAAARWYEMGTISQSRAAEIAGMSRTEFLLAPARFDVSPFHSFPEDREGEIRGAGGGVP